MSVTIPVWLVGLLLVALCVFIGWLRFYFTDGTRSGFDPFPPGCGWLVAALAVALATVSYALGSWLGGGA